VSTINKTIEDKMNELRQAAAWFESDDFSLSEATKKYEQASKLAREVEHDLTEMENQIHVLKQSFEES
jgi:exodeoxyribonuclease VII small subunit